MRKRRAAEMGSLVHLPAGSSIPLPFGQLVMSLSATYIPDGGFTRREVSLYTGLR